LQRKLDKDFAIDVSLIRYSDETLLNDVDGMTDMTYEFDLHESKEEGKAEGRAEGRAEGKAEEAAKALKEKKAMAKGFRDAKVPLEIISAQTGFTTDEIKAL
jgi:predicted transposase YdaD